MAEAIIGPLVGRLHDLAVGEALALVAVNDDIQKLRDKLMWLQAFLREGDAKRRALSDEITKVWLHQTRDAVFDAEDALDHFYRQVDMSRFPWWARPSMAYIATFTVQAPMRRILSGKIKAINSRLEDIIQNKDKYKTVDIETDVYWKPSTTIQYTHRKLDNLHQPYLLLHAKERDELMNALISTDQEMQNVAHRRPVVISVFGKSGVGKTTLVRNVCKEIAKKNHFDVQAMESLGPNLTAHNILHQIVQKLIEENENCPRGKALLMLKEKLRDKKYLLVIDGEVSSTEWKNILTILTGMNACPEGNRIVHITQHKPYEPSSYRHVHINLKNLDEDDTIELFRSRLIHHGQDHDIEVYRQDIICEITEGLPLSIVLLAGLVQSKEYPHEWSQVFNYLKSKKSKRLDNILSLCFDDLPHELKGCFLYFTAFPTNVTIEAHDLVCMWMAEGFVRAMFGKTMEKVGEIYLDELIARNLVNPVHMDDASSAWSLLVTVQNKVHDFLLSEAHEANFLEVHSEDDSPTLTSARRLSLQNYNDKYAALAHTLPKLRSIFSQFEQEHKEEREGNPKEVTRAIAQKKKDVRSHVQGLLRGSEFLRVINLEGIEIGENLPREIGSVVHLQYLGITSCSLKRIPRSIASLTSLQTLDVRKTDVRKLPRSFWMIMQLRHVFGFSLKLPKQIGSLKHLQTLDSIELDDYEQGLITTLGQMIHLENLFVWNVTIGNMVSFSSALSKLEYLRNLALHGTNIPSNVFTTISLRRVRYMVLKGKLELQGKLDDMDSCLPNLAILSLEETEVPQWFITKLAELPSLATLALYHGSYMDEELSFCSDGFVHLTKIKLDVETLKTLEIQKGALPNLQELDILSEQFQHQIIAEPRIKEIIV